MGVGHTESSPLAPPVNYAEWSHIHLLGACRNLEGSDLGLTSLRGHFNAFAFTRARSPPDAAGDAYRPLRGFRRCNFQLKANLPRDLRPAPT